MKLRRLPEDFRVQELTSVRADGGPFALYQLTKTSLGTPEAVNAIVQRWQLQRKRISYGGLKDRHAVTVQYLTVHNGPRKDLQQKSLHLQYLGQTSSAFTAGSFDGNGFHLVLRDMTASDAQQAAVAAEQLQQTGLPNYFDDQRFGSMGLSGEWIGRAWCLSDWERALWLALADPHRDDSSSEKQQKQLLRDLWGQWPECQQRLDRSHRRSIVTYLSDKVKVGRDPDYRGALARISIDLRGLYLSAFQSALWNRLLSRYLDANCTEADRQAYVLVSGSSTFPLRLSDDTAQRLQHTDLPLPSGRIDRPDGQIGDLLDAVLQDEHIELRQLRVKYPRDTFFSKGVRRAMIAPNGLTFSIDDDELYRGKKKMLLSFELPRGSYATILVKRVTEVITPD